MILNTEKLKLELNRFDVFYLFSITIVLLWTALHLCDATKMGPFDPDSALLEFVTHSAPGTLDRIISIISPTG